MTNRRPARRADALKFIALANDDKPRRDAHLLSARIMESLGRYNEMHGYHRGHRPKGSSRLNEHDAKTLDWMTAESERTKEIRAQTLAKAAAAAGVLFTANGTEKSAVERLARKWRALR